MKKAFYFFTAFMAAIGSFFCIYMIFEFFFSHGLSMALSMSLCVPIWMTFFGELGEEAAND